MFYSNIIIMNLCIHHEIENLWKNDALDKVSKWFVKIFLTMKYDHDFLCLDKYLMNMLGNHEF